MALLKDIKTNNKQIILNTARRLFLQDGFKKTTTRKIAEVANVNLGLIAYHYKTKSKLASLIHYEIMDYIHGGLNFKKYQYHNSIQKMFLLYLVSQDTLIRNEDFLNFYLEVLIEDLSEIKVSKYTNEITNNIINEFEVEINPEYKLYSLLLLRGYERTLSKAKLSGEIKINYLEVNKLVVSNYLSFLGIDKKIIKENYDFCISQLDDSTLELLKNT